MDFQEELAAAVVVYILEQKKKTEKRKTWVKPWFKRKVEIGYCPLDCPSVLVGG